MFRAGDVVLHQSGHKFVVACASLDGTEFIPAGWPKSVEQASECLLVKAASDDEHTGFLLQVLASRNDGVRKQWAFVNLLQLQPEGVLAEWHRLGSQRNQAYRAYQNANSEMLEFERRIQAGDFVRKTANNQSKE